MQLIYDCKYNIQGYLNNYKDIVEILPPLACPVCGIKHPLWGHGEYWRNVCDLLSSPVMIPILRYYCSRCKHTVSFIPSFCVPHKQYSAGVISLCFQKIFACGVSLRQLGKSYPSINRVLAGVWLKQWHFSSGGIITVLRNHFGVKRESVDICTGHNSSYISSKSLEAFFVSSDFALSEDLTSCHGLCDVSGKIKCSNRACTGIIKVLQEKFSVLPFSVRLF